MFTIFRSDGPDKQLGTAIENIIRYQRKYTRKVKKIMKTQIGSFQLSYIAENQPYMSDVLLVSCEVY